MSHPRVMIISSAIPAFEVSYPYGLSYTKDVLTVNIWINYIRINASVLLVLYFVTYIAY